MPKPFSTIPDLLRGLMLAGSLLGLATTPGHAQGNGDDANAAIDEPLTDRPLGDGVVQLKDVDYTSSTSTTGPKRYFSPTGNDTRDGLSPATAWKTLTTQQTDGASSTTNYIPTGATLIFASGTYEISNVKLRRNITLQAAPHAKVWLTGSELVTTWTRESFAGRDIWSTTWTHAPNFGLVKRDAIKSYHPVTGAPCTTCTPTPEAWVAGYQDMAFIETNDSEQVLGLKQVPRKEDVRDATASERATFFFDQNSDRLYIGVSPIGKRIRLSKNALAFQLVGVNDRLDDHIVIRGLGFRGYFNTGIEANSENYKLEDCTFAWNALTGVTANNRVVAW